MEKVYVFKAHGEQVERLPIEARSLDEASAPIDHGIYTVFRIYPGRKVLRFRKHLERLAHSARLLGIPFQLDESWLRRAISRAVDEAGADTLRARLTIPRRAPDSAVIALEPFQPLSAEIYERGVRVGLVSVVREQPDAKDTRFIELRKELRKHQPGAFEILLHAENGKILEGVSSNFYAVVAGVLRTAGEGVLPGIARGIVLQVAPAIVEVSFDPIHRYEIPLVEEAFLTSASRGVVPMVQIADQVLGDGKPGFRTSEIRRRYEDQVAAELEPLLPGGDALQYQI